MEKSYIEYKCNICIKKYSSYQSLWIHNKKFHNDNVSNCLHFVSQLSQKVSKSSDIINNKSNKIIEDNKASIYICKKCNKKFDNRQKKWRHQKKCIENNENIEIKELKKENELLKRGLF